MAILETVLMLCLILLLLGLAFFVLMWVLGILGIALPPRVLQILGAIVVVLVLIWFVRAVMGGGLPKLLTVGVAFLA